MASSGNNPPNKTALQRLAGMRHLKKLQLGLSLMNAPLEIPQSMPAGPTIQNISDSKEDDFADEENDDAGGGNNGPRQIIRPPKETIQPPNGRLSLEKAPIDPAYQMKRDRWMKSQTATPAPISPTGGPSSPASNLQSAAEESTDQADINDPVYKIRQAQIAKAKAEEAQTATSADAASAILDNPITKAGSGYAWFIAEISSIPAIFTGFGILDFLAMLPATWWQIYITVAGDSLPVPAFIKNKMPPAIDLKSIGGMGALISVLAINLTFVLLFVLVIGALVAIYLIAEPYIRAFASACHIFPFHPLCKLV